MADVTSTWEKIQQGVKETERLIGQKEYNLAMVKSRQTLEYMVKSLGERACIVDGDMSEIIDQLYEGQWITKSTKEHYHKLRMIGNKAVHEGNSSASDASQAYHILSQEVYAFANEYSPRRRRSSGSAKPASGSRASGGSGASSARRTGAAPSRRRSKKKQSPLEDILRILIPIVCVILLIFIIRALLPDKEKKDNKETSAPTEAVTMAPSQPEEETQGGDIMPTDAPATVYRTTSTLNVRMEPSTEARILVQLAPDTEVNVVGTYDDKWTIINYDGQDAYVATAYLTQ
ncbi:MAG: DUF4145 domain-containing protein [Lachnospiraceae bacterium]|nr:DUF4145 domain-containing protein [Lachnospiraceae bacterium]